MRSAITCLTLVCSALLTAGALAQQRTGRLFMVCTSQENQSNRQSFTIDYDQKTVLGIDPHYRVTVFNEREILWQMKDAQGYSIWFTFDRGTGILDYNIGAIPSSTSYVCQPGTQRY